MILLAKLLGKGSTHENPADMAGRLKVGTASLAARNALGRSHLDCRNETVKIYFIFLERKKKKEEGRTIERVRFHATNTIKARKKGRNFSLILSYFGRSG